MIIIAGQVDFYLPQKIRKTPEFNDTAVMPCAIDLYAKRCYFDGMRDISFGEAPIKNRTIKLIIKTVFNGKLPLKNNENFDYELMDPKILEMTLGEMHAEFKKVGVELDADAKKMGKTLNDGEERLKDDFLYLKQGEKLAVYTVFEDEEDPSKIEISTDEFWSYPKHSQISKVDKEILKRRTEKFFSDKKIVFIDEENE